MLVWMVELTVCYQNVPLENAESTDEADLFEYLLNGYQNFINGNEDMDDMKTDLISKIGILVLLEVHFFRTISHSPDKGN